MIGARRIAACALAGVLIGGTLAAQSWRAPALAAFDEIWSTVNDTYFDPAFGGLDWPAVRAQLRPRVEQAADEAATRGVMRDMLTRLGQSHFVLLSSSSAAETLPGVATVPVDIRADLSGLVIVGVEPMSTAERAGIRAGDRIQAIDGADVAPWFADRAGAADDRARLRAAWQRGYRALHGDPGSRAHLTLVDPGNRVRTAVVVRTRERGEPVVLGNLPPLYVRTRVSESRTPRGRPVGVIAFNVWMTAVAEPFAAAVDTYRNAAGIVIDLRGNPGGLAEMMRGIAGHFLTSPDLMGRMHMRGAELEFRANPRRSTTDGRRVEPYAGPLAILVDELTASTSECFAGALQSLGRARVFGQTTMGEALPAATKRLPNGDVLLYAIGDFVTPDGRRLEGAGVTPDGAVSRSLVDLSRGRDRALETALTWIDGQA